MKMKPYLVGIIAVVLGVAAPAALAQEASTLAVSDAQEFIGAWEISADFQGNPVDMTLTFSDVGGKVLATMSSQQRPEATEITDIKKTDSGLELQWEVDFQGQAATLILTASLKDGKISGTFGDDGGFFSADFEGAKAGGEGASSSSTTSSGGAAEFPPGNASRLPVSDAADFIGSWTVSMEMRGNKMEMTIQLLDVNGVVGGLILSRFSPQPEFIPTMEKTEDGIKLEYEASFGPNTATINILAKIEDGKLVGTFGDTGGFISAEFSGERSETNLLAKLAAGEGEEGEGGQTRRRRRRGGTEAKVSFGDKDVKIAYVGLKTDSTDYASLSRTEDGNIFSYVGGRAIKLFTDTDLHFGETVVKTENVAKDYPGVYSLWLKKSGSGWSLVFNEQPDIWGSQHESSADVAEISLTESEADEEQATLKVELENEGSNGTLRILWGTHVWSADFTADAGEGQPSA